MQVVPAAKHARSRIWTGDHQINRQKHSHYLDQWVSLQVFVCNLVKTLQVNTRAVCCMRAASAAKHALYQLKFEDDWNDDQWMHGRKFLSQKLLPISYDLKEIFFYLWKAFINLLINFIAIMINITAKTIYNFLREQFSSDMFLSYIIG